MPNLLSQVPYMMNKNFSKNYKEKFEKARKEFLATTGIEWVEKGPYDCDYVHITNSRKEGCSADVGKIGGRLILNLSNNSIALNHPISSN